MSTGEDDGDRVFGEHGDLDVPQQKLYPSVGLLDLFFASPSSPPISSMPACRALISGPPACGKTSLLLQFAYNCARQDSSSFVTFLCKPYSLDDSTPCLSQGVDPESDAFARITIKYIHDDEELRKYFAAFHLQQRFPRAVVIDGFYDLFDERSCAERFGHIRPRESAMVKALALCYDAISFAKYTRVQNPSITVFVDTGKIHAKSFGGVSDAHVCEHLNLDMVFTIDVKTRLNLLHLCSANSGREAQCHLLVSDSYVGEAPRLRFIYQRWLLQILTIEALEDSHFCISLGRDDVNPSSKAVKAKYSVIQGQLQLDGIEVHE